MSRSAWMVTAAVVFVFSLVLDVRTLMPDLGYWDTGEFQTIGPVLGIAHPTGYPTYTLLAWLASVVLQPFGNPAYRADLLSALLISGAAALTAIVVMQLTRRWVLGLVAGIALAVAPIPWRLGIRADPHALHLFLSALLLVLLVAWMQRQQAGRAGAGRWLLAASIVFGLAIGNHALTLLLAPGTAVFVLLVAPTILWRQWKLVLACVGSLVLTTVLVYAYIPLRASMEPPLDYAHPTTWEAFRYLVLGEQFRGTFHPLPSLQDGIGIARDKLIDNVGLAAWLSLAGVVLGALRSWRFIVLTTLWFALTFIFAVGYENADIDRYYAVPVFLAVIWAALALDAVWSGALWVWEQLRPGDVHTLAGAAPADRRAQLTRLLVGVIAAALLMVPIARALPDRYKDVDASDDAGARRWMEATFAALDPNAVIVSWWSYSTPLWYGRWVDGLRPDVTIIDDRTILDEGYGDVAGAIDTYLGKRPVYLIRIDYDLPQFEDKYRLVPVTGLPRDTTVYRVLPKGSS